MKPLNIAVVGYGLIGKNHADIVIKNNKFHLSGIVEINKKNLNNFSKQYEIFNSIEELLVNKKIDGAIIATPTDLHYEHSKKFLEKRIPILIEKPISNSLIEANKLINLSKKNKTPILVGHHRRHNNIIKRAKTAIDEGLLGNIRSIISICWFYKPDEYFNIAPWRKEIGAGPISVNLIHDVDLLRYLCGDIKSVFSTISMSKRGFKNEDLASVIFNFVSGATANLTVSDSIVSPWR